MYITRGNFFGYFIASSYLCPFFVAMLLIQVPTPSIVAVVVLLVVNTDIFTDPFRSPTLPLLVVVAFCMRYTFWRRVVKTIAAKLFAMRTVSWFNVPFIRFPYGASPCAVFSALSWRRTSTVTSTVIYCGADDGVPSCLFLRPLAR